MSSSIENKYDEIIESWERITTSSSSSLPPTFQQFEQLGWLLHQCHTIVLHRPPPHHHVATTTDRDDPIHVLYPTLQQSIHHLFDSCTISFQQRIIYDLYHNMLQIISNHNDHHNEEIILLSLQSLVQLHDATPLMTQNLIRMQQQQQQQEQQDADDTKQPSWKIDDIMQPLIHYYYHDQRHDDNNNMNHDRSISFYMLRLIDHIAFSLSTLATRLSSHRSVISSVNDDVFQQSLWDIEQLIQIVLLCQEGNEEVNGHHHQSLWDDFVLYANQRYGADGHWIDSMMARYNHQHDIGDSSLSSTASYLKSVLSTTTTTTTKAQEEEWKNQIAIATRSVGNHHRKQENDHQKTATNDHRHRNNVGGMNELYRRIDQIRSIVPQYGEGFIEIALAYRHGNVEETISLLLSHDPSQWPDILRVTDPQLPRTRPRTSNDHVEYIMDEESKQIAKESIQHFEQQQEKNAYLLHRAMQYDDGDDDDDDNNNRKPRHHHVYDDDDDFITNAYEYDDDYDDQYDDYNPAGLVGKNDAGLFDDEDDNDDDDNDNNTNQRPDANSKNKKNNPTVRHNEEYYDAIRTYNQTMKDIVSDRTYWEQNQNTNHRQTKNHHDRQQQQQQQNYRGPDKVKGGRIPKNRNHHISSSSDNDNDTKADGSGANDANDNSNNNSNNNNNQNNNNHHHHNAARGRGRGGGRGGGREGQRQPANGRGDAGGRMPRSGGGGDTNPSTSTSTTTTTTTTTNPPKNSRQKERNLAKRRDLQKRSMHQQSGGGA